MEDGENSSGQLDVLKTRHLFGGFGHLGSGAQCAHKGSSEWKEAEEVRVTSVERTWPAVLGLTMGKWTTSPGIQVTSRNWKRQRSGFSFFPRAFEETTALLALYFSQ